MNTYRIFLASSNKLKPEREAIEIMLGRMNTDFFKKQTRLELVLWEDIDPEVTIGRKQAHYNSKLKDCSILILVYWGELGKFTQEEYELAYQLLKEKVIKKIYVFEKTSDVTFELNPENIENLTQLKTILNQEDRQFWPIPFEHVDTLTKELEHWINHVFQDEENPDFTFETLKPATLLSPKGPAEPTVFLGREEELSEIRKRLDKGGKLLLINAEGGIGKTTLAAKYWHESLHQYKYNAWLFCENGIANALKELAPQINVDLSNYKTEKEQVEALRMALSGLQDKFLLVLDNANDDKDIWAFKQTFAGFHWHVLFTSRCEGIMPEQAYRIEHLPPPVAKALFIKYYNEPHNPDFEAQVDQILKAINYHTLLVEIFAKNISEAQGITSIDEFIEKLENEGLFMGEDSFEVGSDHTGLHLKRDRAKTDDILNALYNFSPIDENHDLKNALINLAVLPAQDFSIEFLYLLLTDNNKEAKKKLRAVINTLHSNGWLSETKGQYRMNPLIQELSRKKNIVNIGTETELLLERLNRFLANDGSVFKVNTNVITFIMNLIPNIGRNLELCPSLSLASLFFESALFAKIMGNAVSEREALKKYQDIIAVLLEKNPEDHQILREKALSFSLWGDFYLRLGDAKQAEENYSQGLAINRNLVALDEGNTRWQQDLATALSKMGDFYLRLGDAKQAEENYSQGLAIFRNLAALDEGNTSWQQDLATALSKMGDFYLQLGDAKQAEENYSQGLAINRNLAALDEGNTRWQQDLATALSKMGDFYLRLGDAKQAEENYSQDLIISRNLAALDEGNTSWQQDLATALSKMGDFYLQLGDAKQAEENYSQGLAINRNLVALDEGNTRWQQDLATALSKMGDFYLQLGDAKQAEENYSQGLAINRNLVALDEGNTRWQQDLATVLSKMGDFYLRLGDAKQAEENYSQDLIISRNLAALDEGNTRWQQDLATALSKMGDFYLRLGDAKQAEENYSQGLAIFRNLAALDEGNTSWQQDLATALSKMGDFYLQLGDAKQAEENYSQGLAINRNLAALDEGNTRWQQDLATALSKMGDFYSEQGKVNEALQEYIEAKTIHEKLLEIDGENVTFLFDYALDFLRIGILFKNAGQANYKEILSHAQNILQNLCAKIPNDVNYIEHLEMVEGLMEY